MQDSFFLLLITIPLFVGLVLGTTERECECGLPDRFMNTWKDGIDLKKVTELLGSTLSPDEIEYINGMTVVPMVIPEGMSEEEYIKKKMEDDLVLRLGKTMEDTFGSDEDEDQEKINYIMPHVVWQGLLFFGGHIAAAGITIGYHIYPINYPIAVIAVIYPIFGGTITYLWAGPIVLVQEFVLPKFRRKKKVGQV